MEDLTLGMLIQQQPQAKDAVGRILAALCSRHNSRSPKSHIEASEITSHVFLALLSRLRREVNGELGPDQPLYAHLQIDSPDTMRILYQFIPHAVRDLTRRERRHQVKRTGEFDLGWAPDPNTPVEVAAADQEEARRQVANLMPYCTPAEARIVNAYLEAGGDVAAAAAALGITPNYVHQVFFRIRRRIP